MANKTLLTLVILALPLPSFAQSAGSVPVSITLVQIFSVVNALIPVMLALAVLMFLWGIVKFIANAADPDARAGGVRHMVWGMVALFVMVSFWGIIGYFQQSLGISGTLTTPAAPFVDVIPKGLW